MEGPMKYITPRRMAALVVGPVYVWCEAVALNNGALIAGTDMNPNVCRTCHESFPTDNTALVGSLNHCDVVRR